MGWWRIVIYYYCIVVFQLLNYMIRLIRNIFVEGVPPFVRQKIQIEYISIHGVHFHPYSPYRVVRLDRTSIVFGLTEGGTDQNCVNRMQLFYL